MEFPPLPPHHSGLRWLHLEPRSDGRSDRTLPSLLRAHAATLQEVLVMCGSRKYDAKEKKKSWTTSDDYFIPDLAALLGRCGLVALRRLVLCRYAQNHSRYHEGGCGLVTLPPIALQVRSEP